MNLSNSPIIPSKSAQPTFTMRLLTQSYQGPTTKDLVICGTNTKPPSHALQLPVQMAKGSGHGPEVSGCSVSADKVAEDGSREDRSGN